MMESDRPLDIAKDLDVLSLNLIDSLKLMDLIIKAAKLSQCVELSDQVKSQIEELQFIVEENRPLINLFAGQLKQQTKELASVLDEIQETLCESNLNL